MNVILKLLLGPIGKAIGGLLKLGGAFFGGVQYQKGKHAQQQYKLLKKRMGVKQSVQNRIMSRNDNISRLRSNWTRK